MQFVNHQLKIFGIYWQRSYHCKENICIKIHRVCAKHLCFLDVYTKVLILKLLNDIGLFLRLCNKYYTYHVSPSGQMLKNKVQHFYYFDQVEAEFVAKRLARIAFLPNGDEVRLDLIYNSLSIFQLLLFQRNSS